jgi:uncharacterized Zn-finger protein
VEFCIKIVGDCCSSRTLQRLHCAQWGASKVEYARRGRLGTKTWPQLFCWHQQTHNFFVIPAAADFVFLAAWARSSFLRNYNFTYQTSCTLFIRSQPLSLSCCMSSTNTQHGQVFVYIRESKYKFHLDKYCESDFLATRVSLTKVALKEEEREFENSSYQTFFLISESESGGERSMQLKKNRHLILIGFLYARNISLSSGLCYEQNIIRPNSSNQCVSTRAYIQSIFLTHLNNNDDEYIAKHNVGYQISHAIYQQYYYFFCKSIVVKTNIDMRSAFKICAQIKNKHMHARLM